MDEKINEICEKLASILIDIKDMRSLSDTELDAIEGIKSSIDMKTDMTRYLKLSSIHITETNLVLAEHSIMNIIGAMRRVKEYSRKRNNYYPDGDFLKELV